MMDLVLPVLHAVLLWWVGTGLVLYLDGLRGEGARRSLVVMTGLLVLAFWGLWASADSLSVEAAYAAFTCALLVWAWQELAFLSGVLTGPWRQPCPPGLRTGARFRLALRAILHHEISIIACAIGVAAATWGGENQTGLWTFIILWVMRQSAKLNIFLGVRNLNAEFLPERLRYLGSFFACKPMNWLLPLPVTLGSAAVALLVAEALAPGTEPGRVAACMLLATLLALAVLEHWMLVLPVNAAMLWGWGFRSRAGRAAVPVEIVTGFPGAGRTTLLARRLEEGVAVLSADPARLPAWGACTRLDEEPAARVEEALSRWAPRRLVLEPEAFADLEALRETLRRPELRASVGAVRVVFVVDAEHFSRDRARMPGWFARMAAEADEVVLNKADRVDDLTLDGLVAALRVMAPGAVLTLAVHGEALIRRAWSTRLAPACDADGLAAVLRGVAGGAYGEVDRLRGVARAGAGWVEFFVAGGRPGMASFAPRGDEAPVVTVFGRGVDEGRLSAAFAACAVPATA